MRKQGFTLLEMVVVLAIITFLALMAIPSLLGSSMRNAYKDGKESAELLLQSAIRDRDKRELAITGGNPSIKAVEPFAGSYKKLVSDLSAEAPLSEGEHFRVDLEKCPAPKNDLKSCVRVCLEYHSDLAKKIKRKFSEDPHNLKGKDLKPCKDSMGGYTDAWNIRI